MRETIVSCDICKKHIKACDYVYTTKDVKFEASPTYIMPYDSMPVLEGCEMCHDCAYKIRCAMKDTIAELEN